MAIAARLSFGVEDCNGQPSIFLQKGGVACVSSEPLAWRFFETRQWENNLQCVYPDVHM